MNEHVKGYKATLWSGMPKHGHRRTPYNVGGVYSVNADLVLCWSGLHFCKRLCHVYNTYDSGFYTRVFEVEARGRLRSRDDKSCTDRLKFIRELTPEETLLQLAGDAKLASTSGVAIDKAANILYSVIVRERETRDLNTAIVETTQEWRSMPALYHASRRFQWAQAFSKHSAMLICRAAMHDCGITKTELINLVETLLHDPVLQADRDNRN
jgi:hypothetical protein